MVSSDDAFDSPSETTPAFFDQFDADLPSTSAPEVDAPEVTADAKASGEPLPAGAVPATVPPATTRSHRFRKPVLIGAAVLVAALTIGGGTIAALTKTVTISVDGQQRQVTTLAGSVDGALSAAGLNVNAHDTLAPAGGVSISDGSQIVLDRGRLFTVTIDGRTQQIWTTARTVDEALAELGRNPADFQLSANRSRPIPLNGMAVTAATLHTVSMRGSHVHVAHVTSAAPTVAALLTQEHITLGPNDRISPALSTPLTDGVTVTVRTLPTVVIADGAGKAAAKVSDVRTVGDLLKAQHITVGKDDLVTPSPSTALRQGLRITITRVGYQLLTKTQTVAEPADQTVNDDSMDQGTSEVTQQGQAGAVQITYRMKVVNGRRGRRSSWPGRRSNRPSPPSPTSAPTSHRLRRRPPRPPRRASPRVPALAQARVRPRQRRPPRLQRAIIRVRRRITTIRRIGASTGTRSRIANPPTTGLSTPATATTAACSSTSGRG